VNADSFSVRWTGEVQAAYSQATTFRTLSDDGVRLWVDDELVIDDWNLHGPTWRASAPITLTAGVKVALVLEYYDASGGADAHLWWESDSQLNQAIPASQLYPAEIPTATPTRTPTPTRTATPTKTHTPTQTAIPDLIFADGFENGNLSAWTTSSGTGLTVSTTAALSGTYGLRVSITSNTAMYVQDDTPNGETRYRARFRFDPNSIAMGSSNAHSAAVRLLGKAPMAIQVGGGEGVDERDVFRQHLRQPTGQVERVGVRGARDELPHPVAQPVIGVGLGVAIQGDQPVGGIIRVGEGAVGQQVAVGVPGVILPAPAGQAVGGVVAVGRGDGGAARPAPAGDLTQPVADRVVAVGEVAAVNGVVVREIVGPQQPVQVVVSVADDRAT